MRRRRPSPSTWRYNLKVAVALSAATVALVWVLAAPVWWIGDLGVRVSSVVPLVQTEHVPFEPRAWREGGEEVRGRMVEDLARRYPLDGVPASELADLLGRPFTCYVHYEDEPCYVVSLNGDRRAFGIRVAHSGPHVGSALAASLSESGPGLLSGCGI